MRYFSHNQSKRYLHNSRIIALVKLVRELHHNKIINYYSRTSKEKKLLKYNGEL